MINVGQATLAETVTGTLTTISYPAVSGFIRVELVVSIVSDDSRTNFQRIFVSLYFTYVSACLGARPVMLAIPPFLEKHVFLVMVCVTR